MHSFDNQNFATLCHACCAKVPAFGGIVNQYGNPPMWQRPPGFAALVHIILEQQVSLASARAAFNQLLLLLPNPTPAAFLQLSPQQLSACYFSRQKIDYTQGLALALQQGRLNLEALSTLPNAEVVAQLTQLKGIGPWTASIYLMMCLQRSDVFPPGDIALLQSARRVLGPQEALPNYAALLQLSTGWAPHRTIAAYLLWHAYLSARAPGATKAP